MQQWRSVQRLGGALGSGNHVQYVNSECYLWRVHAGAWNSNCESE